jgi:hypothetical protein
MDLTYQPDPTMLLGPTAKSEPTAFDRKGNAPMRAGCRSTRLGL